MIMLQFITHPSEKYNIIDEVKMVLEGGCRWIQLYMEDSSDEDIKKVTEEIIPLCQEAEAILVIDNRINLTLETKVHGVFLGKVKMPALEARETLGAGAIIGVTANTAEDIIAYKKVDVDYVGLGQYKGSTENLSLDDYKNIISEVRNAGIELPIVAIGKITLDDIDDIISTGVNGIAMSEAITNAENPVEYTKQVLAILNNKMFT
ncbi:MAG: thiamine phosphate synthase [Muribaculaceae bacterium]|nr:thiamine phosphate synthase [Muribaculaceae bacterium]